MSALPIIATISGATLRALLGRRRTLLMGILAAVPVLIALLYRVAGRGTVDDDAVLNLLEIRTVLPLTALVFGTAALGAELDDGTGIALLTKPIPRWQIVVAKIGVGGGLTALFAGVSTLVTALLLGGSDASALVAYVVGTVIGAAAYATAFVAVSVMTSRALIVGLAYTLLWEGWLAGILPGTQQLSVREATLGIIDAIAPAANARSGLDLTGTGILLVVVLIGGFLLASVRLARYQVRTAD